MTISCVQMFDHKLYKECRKKYKAIGAFPTVWHKVKGQLTGVVMQRSKQSTK